MKHLNFLSNLLSLSLGSPCTDVSLDRRLTVGSPSGRYCSGLMRLVFILAILLTVGVGNVWGATEKLTMSEMGWTASSTQPTSISATTATIAVAKNSAGTAPTYYSDGLRIYGVKKATTGGTISFTAKTNVTIKGIDFTYTVSNSGVLNIKTGSGSYNTGTKKWTGTLNAGDAVSLVVTNNTNSNPQVRITEIKIQYLAKVTFNANGGSCGTSNVTQADTASTVSLPTPTRDGFTCIGWYTEADGGSKRGNAGGSYKPTASETLFAHWESAASVAVTGVTVAPTSKTIFVGETFDITPTITPANATDKTVAWTTSASGKASVNSSGLVTGVAAGSATITCTTNDGSYTANTDVTVYSASVSIVDEDGTDISGSGVTATISGRTLTASEGSTKYKFKGWKYGTASGTSIASSSSLSTTLTGTPTGNVAVIAEFYKPVTVTWLVGSSSASGSPTTSVKRGSKITALPSTPADNAIGACANKFKGWSATSELIGTGNSAPADLFTSTSDAGVVALTSPTTYRAVFATSYTTKVPTPNTYTHTIESKTWDGTGSQTLTSKSWSLTNNGSYYGYDDTKGQQIGSGSNPASSMTLSSSAFSGTITSVKISTSGASSISATVGVSVGSTDFTKNGDGSTKTVSLTSTNTEYTFSGSATGTITISWAQTSSKAIYFKKIVVGYTTMEDGTDYKDYVTECCTELGSINGSVSWSNGTSATLAWDKMSHVDATTPYTITCKVTGGSSAGSVGSVDLTGSKATCTITGLTAGNSYDFKIAVSAASGYCDKDSTMTSIAPKITVKSAPVALTGSDYAEGATGGGTVKTFIVSGVGLIGALTFTAPTNFQVSTDNGSTWSTSGGSKTLAASGTLSETTIKVRLVEGLSEGSYGGATTYITISGGGAAAVNSSVSITGTVSAACHTPTISGQPAASASYNMNVTATALSVTAAKGDVSDPTLTYQWYSNTANSKTTPTPSPIDGATSSSYTPPTTASGTKYYFCEVSSGACSLTSNISAISVNTPTLSIGDDKTSIAFGDRAKDGSYDLTFTVSGSNLAKDAGISLALSGTNASLFSIDKTSISQTSTGAVSSTTVTVTYSPNVAGDHTATLTISSTGATNKVLSLSGSSKWVVTWKVNGSTSSTTYVANSSKPTPPSAPADNTLNNCANKFMGWSCKSWGSTPKTTGTGEYDDLFTSSDYSTKGPSITKDTVIYAVFAESEAGTKSLTQTDLSSFYCTGSGGCGSATNGYGSYTISSDDGDWSGVCCSAISSTIYSVNIKSGTTTVGGKAVANHLESPTYSGAITNISITATHGGGSNRTLYICSGETANPSTSNLGTISVANGNTSAQNVVPSSSVTSFYIYASDAIQIRNITVSYGSAENYVTQCAANQVRVTYDFNGGTGTACTEGVTTKSASYTVCSNEPEKDYYDFAGWDDGTNTYDAGDTYNLQDNTTFTAQWTPTVYTISYNLNGGTQQVTPAAPTSYTYESSAVTLPTPTYGHNRFDGWYGNADLSTGGVQTSIAAGSNGDKAYYAKWTERHTIVFDADGTETTIWRASDEALNASLAGQGSVPDNPDAPTTCSDKVFMGWTETEIYDYTNSAPADLMNTYTRTVSADKHYYAVWATRSGSVGSYTYSAYATTCCDNHVTLSSPSITGSGTVVFAPVSPAEASPDGTYATCRNDISVTATVTPASGYSCTALSFTRSDSKDVDIDPTISGNLPSAPSAQAFVLSFDKNTDVTVTTAATFTAKGITGWTWKQATVEEQIDIPATVDLYIGQEAWFDLISFTPSDVISDYKGYTPTYNSDDLAQGGKGATRYKIRAKVAKSSMSLTLTSDNNGSVQEVITIRGTALPTATFVDNIHNKTDFTTGDAALPASGILSATIDGTDKRIVYLTQKTPNHADVAEPGSGNACEKSHLHLVGWIDKDWADEHPNATHSEILGAGTGVYYAANTDIDLSAKNGKTFLAVWSKIE